MNQNNKDEIAEQIIESIERDTGKEIFTLRILKDIENGFEVIIVFTDRNIIQGHILVESVDEKMSMRVQGNYI